MKLRDVTQGEFEAFVRDYHRPLERDVYRACDPPYVSYNDLTLGDWPDSVVASYIAGDMLGGERSGFRIATREENDHRPIPELAEVKPGG